MIKDTDIETKDKLSYGKFELISPTAYIPTPNKTDYRVGFINRFFVKKVNDNTIIEVNPKSYTTVNSLFFNKFIIGWKIRGSEKTRYDGKILLGYGVGEYNKRQVFNAEKVLPGIKNYLTNYLQFWIGY